MVFSFYCFMYGNFEQQQYINIKRKIHSRLCFVFMFSILICLNFFSGCKLFLSLVFRPNCAKKPIHRSSFASFKSKITIEKFNCGKVALINFNTTFNVQINSNFKLLSPHLENKTIFQVQRIKICFLKTHHFSIHDMFL